jgi:hypothetical protein
MLKKYALVSDNYVFHTMRFDDENPTASKWIQALDSGASFINMHEYFSVRPTALYDGTNFYLSDDTEKLNPIEKDINTDENVSKYAAIVDGVVIGIFTAENDDVSSFIYEMIVAGMASDPTVIDCTNAENSSDITYGWSYSNLVFSEPK